MFELNDKTDERGQVGIGTLIVFIALVLVAAIAAGVLINTAGFLQSQAEATGEESTSQVSDNIQISGAIGVNPNTGNAGIDEARLTASLAPGAEPIDLSQSSIQYIGDGEATLTTADDSVSIEDLQGNAETSLTDSTDRRIIVLDFTTGTLSNTPVETLEAGESATVVISTSSGSETVIELSVPDPITDDEPVEL